jgi:hypothetical protein
MAGVRQVISAFIMCGSRLRAQSNVDLRRRSLWQNANDRTADDYHRKRHRVLGGKLCPEAELLHSSAVRMPISVVCINLLIGKSEKLNLLNRIGNALRLLWRSR